MSRDLRVFVPVTVCCLSIVNVLNSRPWIFNTVVCFSVLQTSKGINIELYHVTAHRDDFAQDYRSYWEVSIRYICGGIGGVKTDL